MKIALLSLVALALLAANFTLAPLTAEGKKILVAHRGASAYAPEHTLESYRLALKQGADFVEQDLQITKDAVLVCLHDLTLERTTDVKNVFPDRSRTDVTADQPPGTPAAKHWYVSDFTLAEIKRLDAGAWFGAQFKGARVPTFQEAIDVVRGHAGLYPETKAPEVYGRLGFDMERLLIDALKRNKLDQPSAKTPVIIQSFSAESLRKLRATFKTKLPLVFLIHADPQGQWLSAEGMKKAKTFADGIGPNRILVAAEPKIVEWAHAAGLTVTPYTFHAAKDRAEETRAEMRRFLFELGVDALFTDNPDLFPRSPSH